MAETLHRFQQLIDRLNIQGEDGNAHLPQRLEDFPVIATGGDHQLGTGSDDLFHVYQIEPSHPLELEGSLRIIAKVSDPDQSLAQP